MECFLTMVYFINRTVGVPSCLPTNPLFSDLKELMEQKEKQDKTIRKLKKQLKLYVKRVEEFEGELLTG